MQQAILKRLTALEQFARAQGSSPADNIGRKGRETRMAAKQRFQASILTCLSLLESRSAVGTSGTSSQPGGTPTIPAGVGTVALGRSPEAATPWFGLAGESGFLHHTGVVWPWGPWSVQAAPMPRAAHLPITSQEALSSPMNQGFLQQPCGHMQARCGLTQFIGGQHTQWLFTCLSQRVSLWISSPSYTRSWRRRTSRT